MTFNAIAAAVVVAAVLAWIVVMAWMVLSRPALEPDPASARSSVVL